MNNQIIKPIPVYTTRGDVGAFLIYPYIYNQIGEWIGWVTKDKIVYSVLGFYVGFIGSGPRILRHRGDDDAHPRIRPPSIPRRVIPPATVPLAPLLPELSYDEVDVLLDQPDLLHTMDAGEMREDID
jgi:hypothetical protein